MGDVENCALPQPLAAIAPDADDAAAEAIPRAPRRRAAVAHVACGAEHSLAASVCGAVFGWGANYFGQLGLGHTADQLLPRRLPRFEAAPDAPAPRRCRRPCASCAAASTRLR